MPPKLPNGTPGKSSQVWAWLGMPGHTQLKVVVLHAIFHWWISPCNKSTKIFYSFWVSRNPAMWFDKKILVYDLETRIFPDKGIARENGKLQCHYFQQIVMTTFYKTQKNPSILSLFWVLFVYYSTNRSFSWKSVSVTFFCF